VLVSVPLVLARFIVAHWQNWYDDHAHHHKDDNLASHYNLASLWGIFDKFDQFTDRAMQSF
jgi:hypothetical protein